MSFIFLVAIKITKPFKKPIYRNYGLLVILLFIFIFYTCLIFLAEYIDLDFLGLVLLQNKVRYQIYIIS